MPAPPSPSIISLSTANLAHSHTQLLQLPITQQSAQVQNSTSSISLATATPITTSQTTSFDFNNSTTCDDTTNNSNQSTSTINYSNYAYLVRLPPLFLSVSRCFHEASELLLEYGACPNVQDQLGNTPLHLACAKREGACKECIYILLKYHASSLILNNLSQSPSTILFNLKSTIIINKIQLNLMNEIFKKSNKSISIYSSPYNNNNISININNTSINHHNHYNHQHSTTTASNHNNHQAPTNTNSNHIKASSYNNGNNSLTNTLVSLNSIKNNTKKVCIYT